MSNMSYCRFENTLSDLKDCYENINDTSELSKEEAEARTDLIAVCKDIVNEARDFMFTDEDEDEAEGE